MATIKLASFDNERVRFELEYDEKTGKLGRIQCLNDGDARSRGTLVANDGQVISQLLYYAKTSEYQDLTSAEAAKDLRITVDKQGNLVLPFRIHFEYPA